MSKQRYWKWAITELLEIRGTGISVKHQSLIDEIGEILAKHDQEQELVDWRKEKKSYLDEIDRLTQLLTTTEQKPLVWMFCAPSHFANKAGIENFWIPLYANSPQREPLTDEAVKEYSYSKFVVFNNAFTMGVRWAEQQHGIGE